MRPERAATAVIGTALVVVVGDEVPVLPNAAVVPYSNEIAADAVPSEATKPTSDAAVAVISPAPELTAGE